MLRYRMYWRHQTEDIKISHYQFISLMNELSSFTEVSEMIIRHILINVFCTYFRFRLIKLKLW